MADMRELESRIRMELANEANQMTWSGDILFDKILAGVAGAKTRSRAGICKRFVAAAALAALLLVGITLICSTDARVVTAGAVQAIKMVFMFNTSGAVVQKPAGTVYGERAVNLATNLSDAALSQKMGVRVCFPRVLAADYADNFVLKYKDDGVVLAQKIDYESYQNIFNLMGAAITDQQAFDSLRQYQPYRTAGAIYQDRQGRKVGVSVYNKLTVIYASEDLTVTDTTPTKVGDYNAQWIGLSYPDYPDGDLTRKPTGMETTHALLWSSGNTTYEVLAISPLPMKEAIGLAESFMQAQEPLELAR